MGEEAERGSLALLRGDEYRQVLRRAEGLALQGKVEAVAVVFVLKDGSTGHSVALSASNNAALVGELEATKLDVFAGDGRLSGRDDMDGG